MTQPNDAWLSPDSLPSTPAPPPADQPRPDPSRPDQPGPDQPAVVPMAPVVHPAPGPRRRWHPSRGLITAYFAVGVLLLVSGTVAVVHLSARVYGRDAPAALATPARSPYSRAPAAPAPSAAVSDDDPLRNRLGPERVANGRAVTIDGEDDARFRVTVTHGRFRRTACDEYSVQPENGGYLPTEVKVTVLEGEPDISEYDFRFERPDGQWLHSVGGSGCDENYGGLFRRLSAGRTYSTTIVFDVPRQMKGDIVFVYPLLDVAATWAVG